MSAEGAARWPVWVRALVGVFATVGVAYVALMVWISTGRGCFVEDSAIVPSPSGTVVAHVSQRMCNQQAPITEVIVSRRNSSAEKTWAEVVFSAAATRTEAGGYSTVNVYVSWPADDELRISYPYALRYESREEAAAGIKVSYQEVSPHSQ